MREALRVRHYSYRTEQAYLDWARRYILFHGKRHPAEMGAVEVGGFLTHLAAERQVSASTQNQAKAALLFLYQEPLRIDLLCFDAVAQATVNGCYLFNSVMDSPALAGPLRSESDQQVPPRPLRYIPSTHHPRKAHDH